MAKKAPARRSGARKSAKPREGSARKTKARPRGSSGAQGPAQESAARERRIELARGAALPSMLDPERRASWGFHRDETTPDPYMMERNLRYPGGLAQAAKAFEELLGHLVDEPERITSKVTAGYYRCELSVEQWSRLIALDEEWEVRRRASATR